MATTLARNRLIVTVGLLLLLGVVGYKVGNQWWQRRAVEREIATLTQQKQAVEQSTQQLSDSLKLLNSQNYKEQVARQQLNLQKPGEIVINLPSEIPDETAAKPASHWGNAWEWWSYFFAGKTN